MKGNPREGPQATSSGGIADKISVPSYTNVYDVKSVVAIRKSLS